MSDRVVDQFGKMKLEWRQFREMILEKYKVWLSVLSSSPEEVPVELDTLEGFSLRSEGTL